MKVWLTCSRPEVLQRAHQSPGGPLRAPVARVLVWLMPELCVAVVRTLSRPMETRAGDDSTLIQNETHDRMTMSIDGTKTWMRKNPISRRRMNRISWHGNAMSRSTRRRGTNLPKLAKTGPVGVAGNVPKRNIRILEIPEFCCSISVSSRGSSLCQKLVQCGSTVSIQYRAGGSWHGNAPTMRYKLPVIVDSARVVVKKIKCSHTRYRALGPELIPGIQAKDQARR